MAFGLKQAPGIFQRRIDNALCLKQPENILSKIYTVYVDDILVFSKTEEEHYYHVIKVLEQCLKKGIILSQKKAKIAQTKINFLGLELENGSLVMQDHIWKKIQNFPSDIKDKTQLQRFLGILNYVEGYVKNLSEIRKPLQAKLKKDVVFRWDINDSHYVDKIKKKLVSLPALYHPSDDDHMILETDASGSHWGAVLKARCKITDLDRIACDDITVSNPHQVKKCWECDSNASPSTSSSSKALSCTHARFYGISKDSNIFTRNGSTVNCESNFAVNTGVTDLGNSEYTEKLCRYTSGSFQNAELNYHSNEKEYLAVKKGISKFRIYLISKEFTVRIDNKNLSCFLRTNISGDYKQGRLIRWQQWSIITSFKSSTSRESTTLLQIASPKNLQKKNDFPRRSTNPD